MSDIDYNEVVSMLQQKGFIINLEINGKGVCIMRMGMDDYKTHANGVAIDELNNIEKGNAYVDHCAMWLRIYWDFRFGLNAPMPTKNKNV